MHQICVLNPSYGAQRQPAQRIKLPNFTNQNTACHAGSCGLVHEMIPLLGSPKVNYTNMQ